MQNRKLRSLVQNASKYSPFYRRIYDQIGIDISSISSATITSLPIVTRSLMQSAMGSVHIPNLPDWAYRNPGSTGGTTGEPITFYCTPFGGPYKDIDQCYTYSRLWRPLLWEGMTMHDVQHSIRMIQLRHDRNIQNDTQLFINPHDLYNSPGNLIDQIVRFQPKVISCYTTFTTSLCTEIQTQNRTADISIPYIILNGEAGTNEQRIFIEETLSGRTYSRYGLEELYWSIASEDEERNGLIPYYESVIVEIVRDDGSPCEVGEPGRVVLTDLMNYVHPFIRYATGDLGELLERNGPYIKFKILGRDMKLSFGDRKLTHSFVNEIISPFSGKISQYQFRKLSEGRLVVKIVFMKGYNQMITQIIQEELGRVVGPNVDIEIEFVDYIDRTERGKTRPFVDCTKIQRS